LAETFFAPLRPDFFFGEGFDDDIPIAEAVVLRAYFIIELPDVFTDLGMLLAIVFAFAPATPPAIAPTAALTGPSNAPAAAPAAAPTIPRPEVEFDLFEAAAFFAMAADP
jgi:hypothetical protein